jgi:ATP phosphoribosyltransferase regulatory subunit
MKRFLRSIILSKHNVIGAPSGFSFKQRNCLEIFNHLSEIVESEGFNYIDTPMFDFFEVYERTLGTSSTKELFVVKDENNEFLVPRYDITTQIVRFLGPRINDVKLPVKLYYFGDVFRTPDSEWHRKQIKQFGVEIIGSSNEEEIVSLLKKLLEKLRELKVIGEYIVVFNFTVVLDKLMEGFDAEDKELFIELLRVRDLTSISKVFSDKGKEISEIFKEFLKRSSEDVLKLILSKIEAYDNVNKGFQAMRACFGDRILFDPLLVPQMNYYNGVYFVVYTSNSHDPIASGGRYDSLTRKFGYSQSAMGFAIDIP